MTIGKKTRKKLKQTFKKSSISIATLTSAEILRILREKNELTQLELAGKTGLTQATISSLESGRISLGVERAKVLSRALHIHPAVLLFPDWDETQLAA